MSNDLLKISLGQGKLFNTYQTKIKKNVIDKKKKKEGFVTIEQEQLIRPNYKPVLKNIQQSEIQTNKVNQNDLDELTKLQTQYDNLMKKYTDIQTKINTSALDTFNRLNSPYLNKNVQFTNGTIAYITNQGVAKPYTSYDIFINTAGKNGCPSTNVTKIDIPWLSEYIPGATIPTNPPLIVGSNMVNGESCGNEGTNVYVSKLLSSSNSSYVGCYNDKTTNPDDKPAMNSSIGYTTFDKCQEYAIDNGYTYFGLQDVQSDGIANCVVSNDITQTKAYGDAGSQITTTLIWSSNTAGTGATKCYVNNKGQLVLTDVNDNILWNSPNAPEDCSFGGYVNPDTIQGSFGGNCVGKPLNIDCGNPSSTESYNTTGIVGNLNTILKTQAAANSAQANWTFNPMSKWTGDDPAHCCAKLVDYSYQCGGGAFKTGQISGGSNINFDCSNEVNNCSFYLLLQTDGNVSLNRGSETGTNTNIWSTSTSGNQKMPNVTWEAKNGKYGRNYLKMNEPLGPNEWISSDDGSIKLIMQSDGNLALYTSETKSGCNVINDKTYGTNSVNAVYQLTETGDKSLLGKMAYINEDSTLREYPDTMLGFTNDYQIYQTTDSPGNDITSLVTNSQQECQTACDNNDKCSAYVYQGSSQTCWIKNSNAYPKGSKQYNSSTILGVRTPGVKNSSKTCSKKISNIDTIQYSKYTKGDQMTSDTTCNVSMISQTDKIQLDNIKSQLVIISNDIAEKMESLYEQDGKIYEQMNMNAEQFNKSLEQYKEINKTLLDLQNFQSNNIEGMQNINMNMNDLNGMLSDSDLRVLQENYSYIMWSILAVGILTITINTIKK